MRLTEALQLLDTQTYPTTTGELIAAHGGRRIDLPNGTETFEEVLSRNGTEAFADAEEARLSLYGGLSEDAIGRKGYSDRDPPSLGEVEQVSF